MVMMRDKGRDGSKDEQRSLDMARQVISRLVQKLQRMQVQELSVLHLVLRNNFYRVKDFVKVEGT